MSSQQSPFPKGFEQSNPLTPLASHPIAASLATTQPVARRRSYQRNQTEKKQRWLLVVASAAALAVWSAFGLLYYNRHGAPGSLRAVFSSTPESVSISLSPPANGAKPAVTEASAAEQPSLVPTGKAETVIAAPKAEPASAPAKAEPTTKAAAARAAQNDEAAESAATRAAAPAGRPKVDESAKAGGAAKVRPVPVKPRPASGEKVAPKKRPIDEGF